MKKISQAQQSACVDIIPDLPVADSPDQTFECGELAHTLAGLVWNPHRQTPFTVVLRGVEGQAKASLLHQTQRLLARAQSQVSARPVCTLRFNAWRHPDDDSVLVGLLGVLLNEFRQRRLLDQLRFQIESHHFPLARMLLHAAAPWAFTRPIEQMSRQANEAAIDQVSDHKGQFWVVFRDLFLQASHLLFQGTAVVWESGDVVPQALWDAQTQRKYILAIFFDDLDRCTQERLLELVEAIHLLMDLPGVCFFLDLDSERLLGLLSDLLASCQDAFLERLVQVDAATMQDSAGDIDAQDTLLHSPDRSVNTEIEWVKLAAGRFNMGSDQGRGNERPVHVVSLPGFHIARYPVTNAQYAQFVNATDAAPPPHWQDGKIPQGKENHPVVFVSWREAVEFCHWLSKKIAEQGQKGRVQLPSEAEWEYAARGSEGRVYPWGDKAPDKGYCNFNNYVGDTTPVGAYSRGATPEGVYDLAGNVWEWTRSKWEKYPYPAAEKKRIKRESQAGDERRALRGCSFRYGAWFARCACRGNSDPGDRHSRVGFRVVMTTS